MVEKRILTLKEEIHQIKKQNANNILEELSNTAQNVNEADTESDWQEISDTLHELTTTVDQMIALIRFSDFMDQRNIENNNEKQ
ncbi:hypothetical protein [Ligilactobacillus equi]|uniref:Uncharacterized protein n=1 Tax=Ligilactobacillus equi DSM 15833 = JCM 10991 TaxID=1423740 RepID=A0A0R1THK9_9LACO|nr:hypothetical protein [Ligilactobacillus equi]KRL80647.1 hypothetical protein FC36_GL002103 [Ligilactobacillus equi DSM 15833 = JCM 10991]